MPATAKYTNGIATLRNLKAIKPIENHTLMGDGWGRQLLHRLAHCCGVALVGEKSYGMLYGYNPALRKRKATKWNEHHLIVVGFIKRLPRLPVGNYYLRFDMGEKDMVITWRNE